MDELIPGEGGAWSRRRLRTREQILTVGARAFAQEGVDGIRLDALASRAEVARGTLYNYFPSKDALLGAILEPVLEQALRGVKPLRRRKARAAVQGMVDLYLALWRDHEHALCIAFGPQGRLVEQVEELHVRYVREVMALFERAARAGVLRTDDARASAMTFRLTVVPVLGTFAALPEAEQRARETLCAMLLRPE